MKKKLSPEEIYNRLANVEDARACKGIDENACTSVPGNYVTLLISQILSQFADALLNPKVTLPWLMQSLQVPSAFIAWLVPIRESGSLLPQLAIADYVRTLAVRKWVWVCGAIIQSLCILAMVAVGLFLQGDAAGYAIITLLVVFSLARGFNSVAAKDVLGKVIPKKQRGSLSGYAASAAGLATITFGLGLWYFQQQGDKISVLLALGAGALVWLLAAAFYAKIDEYPGATEGGRNGLKHAIKKLNLLKEDTRFAHFVITRALLLCSALSAPFYIIVASEQSFNFSLLALFMGLSGLASLVSGPIWGRLSDLSSKRVLVFAASLVSINGVIVYLVATYANSLLASLAFMPSMYLLLTIAHQGVRLGRKTYLVDMADGNKRTDYVAVSNTVIGVCLLLFGSLGFLGNWLTNAELILIYSVMGIAGAISAMLLPEV